MKIVTEGWMQVHNISLEHHNMGLPRKEQDPTRAERKAKKRKLEDAIPDLPGDNEIAEDSKVGEKSNKKRKVKEGSENIAGKERDSASLNQKGKKIKDKELSKESSTKVEINSANSTTKKKKETLASDVAHSDNAVEFMEPHTPVADDQTPRKSKKERKAARKVAEAAEAAKVISNRVTESVKVGTEPAAVMEVDQVKKAKKNNRNREKKRKGANGTTLGASDADAGEKKEGKAARFIVFIGKIPSPIHDLSN
jgi:nucleolar protein 6